MPQEQTSQRSSRNIPFQAFEHYMLADDRPSHSMTCHIRFWFDGIFERAAFESAVDEALKRHPVFQMTVVGSALLPTGKIHWHHPGGPTKPFINWASESTPLQEPPGGFAQDIRSEIGLRFWLRESIETTHAKTTIIVQFHHSVCDGIGLFQFMEDVFIYYGRAAGIATPEPRVIDPDQFYERGEFSLTPEDWKHRRPVDIARALRFFKSIARPLAPSPRSEIKNPHTADLLAVERVIVSEFILTALRQRSKQVLASVNDLMIHALFLTVAAWNRERGDTRQDIRVAIATSLRGARDAVLSAANVVSMVFLNRSHKAITATGLLEGIVKETSEIKANRLGVTLPRVMRRLGRYPFLTWAFLRLPICSATVVLTNLGRPFADSPLTGPDGLLRIGSLTLTSLDTMPPVRPKTRASISINYYGGSLSMTLRYDSTTITRADAASFLARFRDQVTLGAEPL